MQKQIQNEYCRFPKLEECAHFHYERVQLGKINVRLAQDKYDPHNVTVVQSDANTTSTSNSSTASQSNTWWFILRVTAEKSEPFLIRRSFDNMKMLDEMLHRCVYDRKISNLVDLSELAIQTEEIQIEKIVDVYLERFSEIVTDSLTCGQILTWFQLDNKGQRLPLADSDTMESINTPAVGAAYGIRKYNAQACDEISIEVGDMISVIDMPSPAESAWWRGKKSHLQKSQYEVGFFPQSCVATIGDKVPRNLVLPAPLVGSLDVSPTKPVLRKHGKLIAFFRSFILSRPSRRSLKQHGIYKERVFSCDLSEHLLNSGQEIPMVLKVCSEFIEQYGIVDGIYRLSGITSNIQRLRRGFDEERVPDLANPEVRQDIHAMSSLVKMYFRELPNPLCTYQLYEHFVEAIQSKGDADERLKAMKETVQKLPPPHYRTLKYLMNHLNKIAQHSGRTGMTDRNLAIVWAPNLLRSPSLESGGVAALRGVGVQAVVTEYLITNCHAIFDASDELGNLSENTCDSSVENEENGQNEGRDQDLSLSIERPKSLSVGCTRLISLEEAQNRHNRIEFIENKSNPISTPGGSNSYIEVGGGPSSLPDKYHTVLPVPRSWQKRHKSTTSWKSLFKRNPNPNDIKQTPTAKEAHRKSVTTETKGEEKLKPIIRSSQKKANKSIETFEGKMEVCPRSNSADSLRTAGHSRSVSHDSYFDLLQSPLRTTGVSPSREFSELGLNFDREEPEMRIFSESESLVSSPRVPKEMQSKRVTRCRTDDYSSATNSVNPSPKKQPRLNLPTSKEWNANNRIQNIDDGSLRKRSKVEGHEYNSEDATSLSDIQFIDSITPEHTITPSNTIYACAQIHNPPSTKRASILDDLTPEQRVQLRNPSTANSDKRINDKGDSKDGRFSYPGIGARFSNDKKVQARYSMNENHQRASKEIKERFVRSSIDVVLSSSSPEHLKNNENDYAKNGIASPSSPSRSPRYSLLVGETSSENSSSLNTPVFDMDMSSATQHFDQRMDELRHIPSSAGAKDLSPLLFSTNNENNASQHLLSVSVNANNSDASDIRRDLSLDLEKSKMSVDEMSPSSNKHNINISSTSNTPNFTQTSDSTSQSMTPSEFGYQHLNRLSNAVSLESSPKSDMYESLEQAFADYEHCNAPTTPVQARPQSAKMKSPMKATINITYNLKSPMKTTPAPMNFMYANEPDPSQFPDYEPVNVISSVTKPLETNFDENVVYEQLKFLKGAVSEVNNLLNNGNDDIQQNEIEQDSLNAPQIVPNLNNSTNLNIHKSTNSTKSIVANDQLSSAISDSIADDRSDSGDVLMPDQELTQDSLEFDPNQSMYENVNLRKPENCYENVSMRSDGKSKSLNITQTHLSLGKENSKPANFTVKQLANKFETSPVDAVPPFDFSKPFVRKSCDTNRNATNAPKAKNPQQQHLSKPCNLTRSLDENAFVREFGSTRITDKIMTSTQQIGANILTENSPSRRSNNDPARPKSLNPPKLLPNPTETVNELCKTENPTTDETLVITNCDIKITPTNENPISLIQHNVNSPEDKLNVDDDRNSANAPSNKVLSNFKLDRERIERIKEERRLQLNEKFRSESFKCEKENSKVKSKSKIELNELKDADRKISDSLQYKSKSRNDIYNKKDADSSLALLQPLGSVNDRTANRVRCISDEKNQNEYNAMDENTVAFRTRKFDRKPIDSRREQDNFTLPANGTTVIQRATSQLQREAVSPQISIRDVAAIFESRKQNH